LKAVLYFAAALSVVSTLQMFTSGGRVFWLFPSGYTDFVLGPFVYRNQYAAFIELTLPIAVLFALFTRRHRFRYAVFAAVMFASVVTCASRAGIILAGLELVAIPVLAFRMRLMSGAQARVAIATVAGFTAAAVLLLNSGMVWQRFFREDPYFLRREVLISAVRMFWDRPAMGFGLGTWVVAYPAYAIFDPGVVINQAHNDWMQWAVEGGVLFVTLMLAFAALLFRPALRSLWGIGLFSVFLHALVDYPFQQRPALAAFIFAVAGAVAATATAEHGRASLHIERPDVV
jgi:O-antigen ligase